MSKYNKAMKAQRRLNKDRDSRKRTLISRELKEHWREKNKHREKYNL